MARYRSIAIRLCRLSSSQLKSALGYGLSFPMMPRHKIRLKPIGIDHVGGIEIESLGCLRPPRTVVQRVSRRRGLDDFQDSYIPAPVSDQPVVRKGYPVWVRHRAED